MQNFCFLLLLITITKIMEQDIYAKHNHRKINIYIIVTVKKEC